MDLLWCHYVLKSTESGNHGWRVASNDCLAQCLCVMIVLVGLVNSADRSHAQESDDLFSVGDIGVDVTENAVCAK